MKNQRMKSETRSLRLSKLAVVLVMLATLICCFSLLTSAATETKQLNILPGDVSLDGEWSLKDGVYTKTYDGKTALTLKIDKDPAAYGIDAADVGKVWVVANASLGTADAGTQEISITYELAYKDAAAKTELDGKYALPHNFTRTVKILPKQLTWADGGIVTVAPIDYTYAASYDVSFKAPALVGVINGDDVAVAESSYTVTMNGVKSAVDTPSAQKTVVLAGAKAGNYTITDPITVKTSFNKIQVTVNWGEYNFVYGDQAVYAITVTGTNTTLGRDWALKVVYPEGFNGDAGVYEIKVETPDAANVEIVYPAGATSKQLKIEKKTVQVTVADATYTGDGKESYTIVVGGDIPADIRSRIQYKYNGAVADGISAYGIHTVTATLPSSANYVFVDANNKEITAPLTATLTIKRVYALAGTADQPYLMILVGENGFSGDINATVSTPTLNRRAINGYPYHAGYTLSVSGAAGESFTVYIPVSPSLLHKYAEELKADDLYIYEDVTATLKKANANGYTVTLEDGYFVLKGLSGDATVSFVVAPEYDPPFWMTAWGIALIVLAILVIIAILTLIGLYLRRVELEKQNEATVIDTEGDVPEVVPVVIPDKVDEDAALDEGTDRKIEELTEEVDAEAAEEPAVDEAEVDSAVAESMDELMDEVSAIELDSEETTEETDETVTGEMADEIADSLLETVEAEAEEPVEADEDAVQAVVDETIAENLNESADAADAIVLVADVEEEETDELSPEAFKAVVDVIVSDAMTATMVLPEAEESAEEASEETAEAAVEETAETTENVVIEEMSNEDVCAIVATSVAEAFDMIVADGIVPTAVEGTTEQTIADAVNASAAENIPENWSEEMADAVKAAIVDELVARLLTEAPAEEEPAVEAFVAVEEPVETADEDDDNDNDNDNDNDDDNDDDDDDSFGGFGSMPLTFIDAVEEAEKYQEMLEQEARGEIHIVTRYRRSFQSRLVQSQGNVQDYYNAIKNALLSYKGVKNRISWNYEAFNKGRTHVAKLNAKTKTLYLYLALNPEDLVGTKYGIVDMSSKKKYASVPVLMKIKGERKFKYALELIAKLCGEDLTLPAVNNYEEVDYRMPYQTTEELVQAGILKKLVASVPVNYNEDAVAEEPTESTTASLEEQEMTFIAPTDAPAVVEAAEEVAAEEAAAEEVVAEETVAEEVPADAEASEETTEI